MTIEYKLSEEVCLQCLRVTLKRNGWIEWFLNPTAGPWKKIRIDGIENDALLRFRKEEDRPDLIISNKSKSLILVLEAKDDIEKLIGINNQVQKSVKTFRLTFKKLQILLEQYRDTVFGVSPVREKMELLCGYVVPAKSGMNGLNRKLAQLSTLHKIECRRANESKVLRPHVVFIITINSSRNLHVKYYLNSCPTNLSNKIHKLFPSSVKEITLPLDLSDY